MRHILILAALLCVSCGTQLPSIKPFKLDIQQGNVVTSKMLLQLRPGMTKSQVRFIMGTPLVQDSFHGNRWDYVYQMRENGKIKEQRRVILDFEKELLKSVRGDVVPAGSELAKEPETVAPTGTRVVPPVKVEKEKSLLDKLKFWGDDEAESKARAESATPAKQELKQSAERVSPTPITAAPAKTDAKQAPEEAPSMLAVPIAVSDADNAAKAISLPSAESAASLPATESSATESSAPQSVATPAAVSKPAVSQSAAPEKVVSEPVVSVPAAAPASPAAVVEPIAVPQESAAPAIEAAEAAMPKPAQPINPYHYQSPAGMQFDRKLQIEDDEVPPVIELSGSRTGNKVAPQPKPLPPETEPSFFDRMLEQIGF